MDCYRSVGTTGGRRRAPILDAGSVLVAIAAAAVAVAPRPAGAAVFNVGSNAELGAALGSVAPGDEIVLANGSYAGFTITRSGTADAPILIRAANVGQATISSGIIRFSNTAYVTVRGLTLTTSGAAQNVDGNSRKLAVWFEAANNCRLTRSRLRLSGHTGSTEWVMLSGNSQFNRIDHNEFGPNNVDGHLIWPRGNPTIPGVTPPDDRTSWANGNGPFNPNMARNTLIDHNYFHDHLPTVSNGGELIVLGAFGKTGDYQDVFTTIEYNLFEDSWGDGELVSFKSSSNTFRYNTVRRCGGGPVSRAGNKSHIYGNFMLQANRNGSSGIRIHEMDHLIFNNYIENANGNVIQVGDGDPYGEGGFSHAQVKRAKIFNNTFVNSGAFKIGNAHPLDPVELLVANNILSGTGFSGPAALSSWIYSTNLIFPSNPGVGGFSSVNPMLALVGGLQKLLPGSPAINAANPSFFPWLAEDMDGQPRDDADVGADELSSRPGLRRPLTTADVGPASPEGAITTAWEAERVNRAASGAAAASLATDGGASGGFWVSFAADGAGDFVEYTLPHVPAGRYELRLRYRAQPTRGTLQARVDGAALGTLDQFAADSQYRTATLGSLSFARDGSHVVRLSVTGRNPDATGFTLSADALALVAGGGPGQVAEPVFDPAGGSFPGPVSVAIASATAEAAIRYTTDGSAPSSSSGTLYTGPVAIGATTTLRAIAFKEPMEDSAVTSATYTIGTTQNPVLREAEGIPFTTSGEASEVVSDPRTSAGAWRAFLANGVDDFIEYTLPDIPAGRYELRMLFKAHPNRGILNVRVNGSLRPGTIDQFSASPDYREVSLGLVDIAAAGAQSVRLTVTGRTAGSGAFNLAADAFRLVPAAGGAARPR